MEQWQIPAAVVDSMIAHARREAPNECCGLLVGRDHVIERSVETDNAADTPRTSYLVDPRAHFALLRELRGTTRALVGAYHSHVSSPPQPSQADIDRAWTEEFLYVIVSLVDEARPDVRAFRIAERGWVPVELATGSRP